MVEEILRQSLQPVLTDIQASGAPVPDVRDESWQDDPDTASAMLYAPDGSGIGVWTTVDSAEADRIATVADQVQEWVIEQLWGSATTNWPACPLHPGTHPLAAVVRAGPVWQCPATGESIAPVGALGR